MDQPVRVNRNGDYVTVTLSNAAKRNALSLDVLLALTTAFDDIGRSDALGVILAAEGPVFSAGHNFGEMKGASEADALHLFTVCSELMQTMHSIPQPIVARVHALATAAGCQLVATCDLAVASESAGFAIPGGKGGLFCHTPLVAVARSLTPKRALEMAMTGDVISAQTALEWGFINEVVADGELQNATQSLLERACRGSRESKGIGKKAFYRQVSMNESDAYAFASAVMAESVVSDVAQEGINAFLEKRPPDFGGR
ncbi:MAG: enoyl-CoA hydratase-related protein [Actinobacteria bacterium]|nr:enoyl-CoA hydratase-related protein [Actinomycetota bacterium]